MDKQEVLLRIGMIRNKANLSARELSLRMGMSPQYVSKIENGKTVLTVEKLLDILEICNCSFEKFASKSPEEYEIDKELINLIKKLPANKREHLLELLK